MGVPVNFHVNVGDDVSSRRCADWLIVALLDLQARPSDKVTIFRLLRQPCLHFTLHGVKRF